MGEPVERRGRHPDGRREVAEELALAITGDLQEVTALETVTEGKRDRLTILVGTAASREVSEAGVSGSGKSSLVSQAVPALLREHLGSGGAPEPELTGDPETDLLFGDDVDDVRGRVTEAPPGVRRVVVIAASNGASVRSIFAMRLAPSHRW